MNGLEKILVIGGDGTLGNAFNQLQIEINSQIFLTTRNINSISNNKIYLDLNSENFTQIINEFSTIIYVAQSREYKKFPEGVTDLTKINITAPIKLAELCARSLKQFVYCSTGSVYASSSYALLEASPVKKEGSWDSYSLSKYLAEKTIQDLNPTALIVRLFFLFGSSPGNSTLIPNLRKSLIAGNKINLVGENGLRFNPISAKEAARAILHLVENQFVGVYNVAGNWVTNVRNIVNLIAKTEHLSPNYSQLEGENACIADVSKLSKSGFRFASDISKELENYILELKLT